MILKDNGHFENERVRVYNKIPQEEIAILLNEIDIVICTSKHETLHLAGIESMFCNVPVVANDVGIYKTLKGDDRWGVVINKYCAEEYIKTIEGIFLVIISGQKIRL